MRRIVRVAIFQFGYHFPHCIQKVQVGPRIQVSSSYRTGGVGGKYQNRRDPFANMLLHLIGNINDFPVLSGLNLQVHKSILTRDDMFRPRVSPGPLSVHLFYISPFRRKRQPTSAQLIRHQYPTSFLLALPGGWQAQV